LTLRSVSRKLGVLAGLPTLGRTINRAKLLVLCYHGVASADDSESSWLQVPRAVFEEHMRYVAEHYDCVHLEEGLSKLSSGVLARPTACVTFDDGYRNNLTEAYPVLERLGVPATVYLSTGLIGTGDTLWTTRLRLAFAQTVDRQLDLTSLQLGILRTPEADRLVETICHRLKATGSRERAAALAQIEAQLTPPQVPDAFRFMTWEEVATLARSGLVRIGGHTVNHEIVSRLDDHALRAEIIDSVGAITAHVAQPQRSRTFAYPNGTRGDFDHRAVDVLRECGITSAVTTIHGLNSRATNAYEIRRIVIGGNDSFDSFLLQTAGIA
jgi:peptidoglycan/xylan/chitin deacetylase (PgdA/CDA1 family)